MQIYAIGYAGMSFKRFIKFLKRNDIGVLIDVRRFPTSKYKEFSKQNLSRLLEKEGIKYVHLPQLGGFRGDYKVYMKTAQFVDGINFLMKQKEPTCIMCKERNSKYCHRRFIKAYLHKVGIKVKELEKITKF